MAQPPSAIGPELANGFRARYRKAASSGRARKQARSIQREIFAETSPSGRLAPDDSYTALVGIEESALSRAREVVREMSAAEWLVAMRSIQGVSGGHKVKRSWIAEHMAYVLSNQVSPQIEGAFPPPWMSQRGSPQLDLLLQLVACADLILELEELLAMAGAGSSIDFRPGMRPKAQPSAEVKGPAELFVRRGAGRHADALSRAGLVAPHEMLGARTAPTDGILLIEPLARPRLGIAPPFVDLGASVPIWHHPRLMNLEDLRVLGNQDIPEDIRWPPMLSELICLMSLGVFDMAANYSMVVTFGFAIHPEQAVVAHLNEALVLVREALGGVAPDHRIPSNGNAALETLMSLRGDCLPFFPPSPIRSAGAGQLLVDYTIASAAFFEGFARPEARSPEIVPWTRTFEDHVQDLIDESPMAPPPELRALVGRDLRINGRLVTDLDALAVFQNTAVLVSCKSVTLSEEFERFEPSAMKRVAAHAEDDALAWSRRVGTIRDNPSGDNFSFAGYEVAGVVVWPFRPFAVDKRSLAENWPGLYGVSGIGEFWRWCNPGLVPHTPGAMRRPLPR